MPIYKFKCEKCGKMEEILCSFSKKSENVNRLTCSRCHSKEFTEVLKLNFGSEKESMSSSSCSASSCNTCGGCG